MARTALKNKCNKRKEDVSRALSNGKKPKHITKSYNICEKCGRNGGYMRKFGLCRICFRELAASGKITGVTKSSW